MFNLILCFFSDRCQADTARERRIADARHAVGDYSCFAAANQSIGSRFNNGIAIIA